MMFVGGGRTVLDTYVLREGVDSFARVTRRFGVLLEVAWPVRRGQRFALFTMLTLILVSGASVGAAQDVPDTQVTGIRVRTPNGTRREPLEHDGASMLSAHLGDTLVVEVRGMESLKEEEHARGQPVVLFLDDHPFTGLSPFTVVPDKDDRPGELYFRLSPPPNSREVWALVFGRPDFDPRPTKVSVGFAGTAPVPTSVTSEDFSVVVLAPGWLTLWVALYVVILIGFIVLARKSEVLRVLGPPAPTDGRRPFSLARTQMAWWFFIVLGSYFFIGLVLGDFSSSINSTVLVLMGISGGTALGAITVEQTKEQRKEQANQQTALPASEGFWIDILSDNDGVSVNRFQLVGWSVVLGFVFVASVYQDFAMPVFSETLLTLLGISAGAYVTIKTWEK